MLNAEYWMLSAESYKLRAKSQRRKAKSVFLLPALPTHTHARQNRLPQSRHRCAANLVLIVGQVLALEEHVEALGQRVGDSSAEYEIRTQRQQVLIVIEFIAGGAALYGDEEVLGRRPCALEGEFVLRHEGNDVAHQGGIGGEANHV